MVAGGSMTAMHWVAWWSWPGCAARTCRSATLPAMHRALDLGIIFLDTADVYGDGENEKLVGEAITGRRDEVVLATKVGIMRTNFTSRTAAVNGSPDYVRAAIDGSLRRLKVDHVDLYYQHRPDPEVPGGGRSGRSPAGTTRCPGLTAIPLRCRVSGPREWRCEL